MAEKQKFPVHLYNKAGQVAISDNAEQLEKNRNKGFTLAYRNQSFPKKLYNAQGQTRRVLNQAEMDKALAEGFAVGFVAAPEVQSPGAVQAANSGETSLLIREIGQLNSRLDATEEQTKKQLADLAGQVSILTQTLNTILQSAAEDEAPAVEERPKGAKKGSAPRREEVTA